MEICLPNVCSIVLGALIIIIGIVSFVYTAKVGTGLEDIRCSMVTFTDSIIFGANSTNYTWIGVLPV